MSVTSKERLQLTLQGQRLTIQHQQLKCSQLEEKLHQMEIELKSSINVDDQLSDDFINIFGQNSYGDAEMAVTAQYCQMVDSFFDCLNVRGVMENMHKRKPNLAPYTDMNDPRFSWLEEEFLNYLTEWKASIEAREGFSKDAQSRMFISWQTFEGLQITVFSIIEVVKYLLSQGMEFVLTERFCQDPAEEYVVIILT